MATILARHPNAARSLLAAPHMAGGPTFTVLPGGGADFGDPSPTAPIRIVVVQSATMVDGAITPDTVKVICLATSVVGDAIGGLTPVEGTSDRDFAAGEPIAVLITGGDIDDVGDLALTLEAVVDEHAAALDLKAPLDSPTFTDVPAAPTASPGTSTDQLATTAFVAAAIAVVATPAVAATSDLPAPGVSYRGRSYLVRGTTGVRDRCFRCILDSDGSYTWEQY